MQIVGDDSAFAGIVVGSDQKHFSRCLRKTPNRPKVWLSDARAAQNKHFYLANPESVGAILVSLEKPDAADAAYQQTDRKIGYSISICVLFAGRAIAPHFLDASDRVMRREMR